MPSSTFRSAAAANDDGGIPRSNIVALPPPSYEEVVAESHVVRSPILTPCPVSVSPASTSSLSSTVPPPPSYDALYGRVSQARNKIAPQVFDYVQTTCSCFPSGTIAVIVYIIPVLMILLGAIYVHDCPQGKFIPGWMIIGGFIWLIKALLLLTTFVRHTVEEQRLERQRQQHTRNIVHSFMFGWFLIGSYIVYRIGRPNFDERHGPHCARPLYEFAFVLLSAVYAAIALMAAATVLIVLLTVCSLIGGQSQGGQRGSARSAATASSNGANSSASMV